MESEKENLERSLAWADNPMPELLRLSWPIAVSMLSYAVMTLVDTLFVGRLGPSALAGVGLGGMAAFTLLCGSFGLLRGIKVLVSQSLGAGRRQGAEAYLGAGLMLAAVIGIVTVLLGQLLALALPLIAATEASGQAAHGYHRVRILGAPLVLAYVALREYRYGIGDSRTPMVAVVVANIVNIVLDYVFIFGLDLGVEGAAWATVIGNVSAGSIMVYASWKRGFGLGEARREHLRAVLRIGIPTGLQFLLEVGAFSLLAAMLAALSEVEMAAHQIAIQVIHFAFLPTLAVSEAGSVLAGQAVGARREALVHRVARLGMIVAGAYAGFCTVVLALLAEPIAAGFTDDPGLFSVAVHLLWVAAIFQIFDAANVVSRGVLRGTGDVRYPAVIGIVCAWVFTPPLTWLLGYELGLGALGGWIGLCIEIIISGVLLWRRLAGGGWRAAAAESRAMLEADGERSSVEVVFAPAE